MRALQKLGGRARMARLLPSFERRLRLRRPALGRRRARVARLLPSLRLARGRVGGPSRPQRLVQLFAPFVASSAHNSQRVRVYSIGRDERSRPQCRRRVLAHHR